MPLVVDEFVSDTQAKGTSGNVCSSIYALKLGQGAGVMGLEHGGIQIEEIGELETKDATRHRIKAVESLAWVRRLLTPVQVNIGQNQINLAQ